MSTVDTLQSANTVAIPSTASQEARFRSSSLVCQRNTRERLVGAKAQPERRRVGGAVRRLLLLRRNVVPIMIETTQWQA